MKNLISHKNEYDNEKDDNENEPYECEWALIMNMTMNMSFKNEYDNEKLW